MDLFDEFFALVSAFEEAGIDYAVVGGVAMAVHDVPRFTQDIDVLVEGAAFNTAHAVMTQLGFEATMPPWSLQYAGLRLHRYAKAVEDDLVVVDVMVGLTERHGRILAGVDRLPWAGGVVRVASRADLIWLKKQRGSPQDALDIERLTIDENRDGNQTAQWPESILPAAAGHEVVSAAAAATRGA